MILVEVYLPVLDKEYDFQLDETAPIRVVTEEIAEVVCYQERCALKGDAADLILCQYEHHRILSRNSTLSENGIGSGDRLVLL